MQHTAELFDEVQVNCVCIHSRARLKVSSPPGLDQCPDEPRGRQFTQSPSMGWPGPIGRVWPSFTTGDNPPMTFPGYTAVGGPVHSAQHVEEDWQSMSGTAVYMQVIVSGRHGRYLEMTPLSANMMNFVLLLSMAYICSKRYFFCFSFPKQGTNCGS